VSIGSGYVRESCTTINTCCFVCVDGVNSRDGARVVRRILKQFLFVSVDMGLTPGRNEERQSFEISDKKTAKRDVPPCTNDPPLQTRNKS
jgi:hypothetical protein